MKIKTVELMGMSLDWAVKAAVDRPLEAGEFLSAYKFGYSECAYSSNADAAIRVLREFGISMSLRYGSRPPIWDGLCKPDYYPTGVAGSGIKKERMASANDPIEAGLRTLVLGRLGDEVDVPDEIADETSDLMVRYEEAGIELLSTTPLDRILAAAKAHGEDDDPDHEVGDLQEVLRAAWSRMTPEQRLMLTLSPEVQAVLANGADIPANKPKHA